MTTSLSPSPAAVQTRTTVVLIAAQLCGGTGLAAAVTVGGTIAADVAGPPAAGLPLAVAVAGTAATAMRLGSLMQRHGRRVGLRWGWQIGAAGAFLGFAATSIRSLPLLLLAMLLFGGGEAASTAARFAATDLAGRRGGAMGVVLSATAVSTTAGPMLVGPTTRLAGELGVPPLAGPFLLAGVAFSAAAAIIGVALRPDPLLVARGPRGRPSEDARPAWQALLLLVRSPARRGLVALTTANLVMLSIMTITPVHLSETGHGAARTVAPGLGLLLGLHLAGMYAPSPLSGWLSDRIGSRRVIALGGGAMALAGLLVGGTGANPRLLWPALVFLGVGWNLSFMGGSVAMTNAIEERHRARVQATADAFMGVAGMVGSAASGLILFVGGLGAGGLIGAVLATGLAVTALRAPALRPSGGLDVVVPRRHQRAEAGGATAG